MKLLKINRRLFVKSATAGASLAALPGILKAQQAPSQNVAGANSRINVACVGFSDRFKDALLPSFIKSKDELNFDMVALADLWSQRRTEGKARIEEKIGHGIDLYKSDEDLYEKAKNVDAVIISTAESSILDDTAFLYIHRVDPTLTQHFVKRMCDILISILGLIVLSPVMLATAVTLTAPRVIREASSIRFITRSFIVGKIGPEGRIPATLASRPRHGQAGGCDSAGEGADGRMMGGGRD